MYRLLNKQEEGLEYIVLENADGNSKARLCLNQGGRLDQLVINGNRIIADMHPSTYKSNYASAILFPFVNRLRDGKYSFNKVNYSLECNEPERNNALHGLVYNKSFTVVDKTLTTDYTSVTLSYNDNGKCEGFPFKFNITLTYALYNNGITLDVVVTNKDQHAFPFNLGWHPYFKSADLYNSFLKFDCDKQLEFDQQQITSGTKEFNEAMPFQIKNKQLDDCYLLQSNEVEFITPNFNLKIEASSKENFLQVFTPSDKNVIAIEPMTAIADSFNNEIGLQILEANEDYNLQWKLEIENIT